MNRDRNVWSTERSRAEAAALERLSRSLFSNLPDSPPEHALSPLEQITFSVSCNPKESVHARRSGFPGSKTTRLNVEAAEERIAWLRDKQERMIRGELIPIHAFGRHTPESIGCAIRALECCLLYGKMTGERPSVHHVLALLLRHPELNGVEDPRIATTVTAMCTDLLGGKRRARGSSVFWNGNARHLTSFLGRTWRSPEGEQLPLIAGLVQIVAETPGKMFLTDEVAQRLLPDLETRFRASALSALFEILSAAGVVVRQPDYRMDGGNPRASWSLKNASYLRAPANNPMLRLLEHAALDQAGWLADVTAQANRSSPDLFAIKALSLAAARLARLGLVSNKKEVPGDSPEVPPPAVEFLRGRAIRRVTLTDAARETVMSWARTPVGECLSARSWEKLRRALVHGKPLIGA